MTLKTYISYYLQKYDYGPKEQTNSSCWSTQALKDVHREVCTLFLKVKNSELEYPESGAIYFWSNDKYVSCLVIKIVS